MLQADLSLGQIAAEVPGATRLFRQYQLDFCCAGQQSLAEAAARAKLELAPLLNALQQLQAEPGKRNWSEASAAELIEHLLTRYHQRHREQLDELIALAGKVERVHFDHPACPVGLYEHLQDMEEELEAHMQKEEQILFPMIQQGMLAMAGGPIAVMRFEHDHHGEALRSLKRLAHDFQLPEGACHSWRALYLGVEELYNDLLEHIHLENNILFIGANRSTS